MIKHAWLVSLSLLLAGLMPSGCYEASNPTQDVPLDDGQGADGDTAGQDADVLPDRPDLPPDYPPDYPVDWPPDYPPDWSPDYPPDWPPDYPPDWPDTTCVSEGCSASYGVMCCPGLVAASECDPSSGDPACMTMFCIRAGDGFCGAHESCYNSPTDCRTPSCEGGSGMGYSCGMIESHNCSCTGGECRPVCMSDSAGNSGWFDGCSGALIRSDDCRGQAAVCDELCTRSEGWYESMTGELIWWAFCAYRWECQVVW